MPSWREHVAEVAHACSGVAVIVEDGLEALPPSSLAEVLASGVHELFEPGDAGPASALRLQWVLARQSQWRQLADAAARAVDAADAATDPATGLPTRRQLIDHLHHLVALREREPAPIGVVVLRVESQRAVSDAAMSDADAELASALLRRKLAVRIRGALRASDVVATLGPDRFGVLLSALDQAGHAQVVAEKLIAALMRPYSVGGQPVSVAVSVGVRVMPGDGNEPQTLLDEAHVLADAAPVRGRAGLGRAGAAGMPLAANDED